MISSKPNLYLSFGSVFTLSSVEQPATLPIFKCKYCRLPVFIHRNLTLCHKKKPRQTVAVCQNKKTKG